MEALDPGAGAAAAPEAVAAGAGELLDDAAPLDPVAALEELVPLDPLLEVAALPPAAAVAFLSIPPWPLQAPRPPCGEVVPSLQVTGLAVSAELTAGTANNAALANTP